MDKLDSVFEKFVDYLDKRNGSSGQIIIGYFPPRGEYIDRFLVRAKNELTRRGQGDFRLLDMVWFQMGRHMPSDYRDIYVVNEPVRETL